MQIEQRPITAIKPYGKNAKKHPAKQVEQVAASIKAFGFNQPIVVDANMEIVVGHGLYAAAQWLQLSMVPVLQVDLTEEQAKAYRLADNKLNESEWDMDLVIAELKELALEMVDLTGFSRGLVLNDDTKDDEVPEVPEIARTQVGDLYELGGHRLLCADSTKKESYTILLGTVQADMLFSDPPYNVNYHGTGKNTSEGIMNDKMEDAAFRSFLKDAFTAMHTFLKAGGGGYVFHSSTTQIQFEEALSQSDFEIKAQLIWNKPMLGLGAGDYRSKHEPFFYVGLKGAGLQFYGDRTNASVWDFQKSDAQLVKWAKAQKEAEAEGRTTIWTMKRESVQEYVDPTQKPIELITYALNNSSKVEDIVLDPFAGSGSTLIACEKTNRYCYTMELDPKYVDVIVQRWCDYTSNEKVIKNGEQIVW